MTPQVSVLIPSYNHARFLSDALESVLAQSFGDWEVVLVDDGSKDNSIEVARSFKDERIRVYQNETNLGTYGNEQRALELSEAPLVAVLNSDDLWAPDKLDKQVRALKEHAECSFSYVLGWMVDTEGNQDVSNDVHFDWPTEALQRPLPNLLYENRILASGVVFRKDGLRFETSLRYSGDWAALLEASTRGTAACIPERLTCWRQHETNTYRVSVKQVLEEIRIRTAIDRQAERWFEAHPNRKDIRIGLAKNAMNLLVLHVYFQDMQRARLFAARSLKWHPDKLKPLKRALSAYLPAKLAQKHFSSVTELDWETLDCAAIQKAIRDLKQLDFRI